ncbi:hypothetical protein CVIRNUC_007795 [Coccomyxa viridis]|uniref:Glycosyltransferase 61 catalytic domain-containing protein n=1 Tax=Coccomyxa viridis TaxID=1274662 RepID=A0AAV1IB41_9CHLO|nr:hypothetical protein CVIRNUC_007795 [Coccomyxa viridis]
MSIGDERSLHDLHAESADIHSLSKGREEGACEAPYVGWDELEEHGCLARHKVCIDQNRFITFDERMVPGPSYQKDGLFFDQHAHHNIPGYQDNVMGAKAAYYEVMARANSSSDPADIQEPSFQKCEVPLVWWPWWPFNAADVFMGSLLPLERMLREGAISSQVRPVPVLDGLRLPAFYQWWFAPFFERKVTPLADISDRSRAGRRCFEHVIMCSPQGIFNQPANGSWLNGTLPFATGQQIVDYHIEKVPTSQPVSTPGLPAPKQDLLKVALIERSNTRHIVNLPDILTACNEELQAAGRQAHCTALSFDGVNDFPALLRELQTVDVLVGVHGAGLINSFFMRPGSAMVEIFPCRFPADWASHYFWRPALVERRIMPFQVHMQDEARCQPSQLEKSPAGVNYHEGAEFVRASLARDQDVLIDFRALQQVINRIERLKGSLDSLPDRMANLSPSYFVVSS